MNIVLISASRVDASRNPVTQVCDLPNYGFVHLEDTKRARLGESGP